VRGVTEFLAALAGALVGGGATFYASWWQTKRVLEHETKQARDAANDERKAARHSVSRWAVVELLGLLSDVERAVPHLARAVGRPGLMPTEMQEHVEEVTDALDVLGRAQAAQVPLLPDPVQKRWGHLRMLAGDLHAARPVATDAPDRADWTELKIDRKG
jgi:hypothetical protein